MLITGPHTTYSLPALSLPQLPGTMLDHLAHTPRQPSGNAITSTRQPAPQQTFIIHIMLHMKHGIIKKYGGILLALHAHLGRHL